MNRKEAEAHVRANLDTPLRQLARETGFSFTWNREMKMNIRHGMGIPEPDSIEIRHQRVRASLIAHPELPNLVHAQKGGYPSETVARTLRKQLERQGVIEKTDVRLTVRGDKTRAIRLPLLEAYARPIKQVTRFSTVVLKLTEDDRFPANEREINTRYRSDIERAIANLQVALERIGEVK